MEFLLTSYIYPLKEKLLLSKHFNFYLDNPRTSDEVKIVKQFLKKSYHSGEDLKIPPKFKDEGLNEQYVTLEKLLRELRDYFYEKDEVFTNFFDKYENKSIFELVARMWVIARFDDEGESKRLRQSHKEYKRAGKQVLFMLEDESPIVKGSAALLSYGHLLSLLIHTENEDYFGRFIFFDTYASNSRMRLWHEFFMFVMWCQSYVDSDETKENHWRKDGSRWTFFPYFLENLEHVRNLLDKALSNGLEEKLLYVGNTLKIAHDIWEEKSRLLMLTSVIEMLLTHNPNTNRFNVEDSINKQFQLKTSILVYLNDKSRDIIAIQKRLKTIYEQRSNIAHGNFNSVNKYIRNLPKKDGEEEYFSSLISDLYLYIRAILEEYLKDRNFVEFLKDN